MNWLCNALLVALCAPLAAQSVRSFDDDDLQRVVDELLPVIEKVCGRKFQSPPVAYLADSVDMERILRVELKAITESELKGQPRSRIRRALQMRAGLQGQGLIGKFEFSSGELLVVPSKVRLSMGVLGLDYSNEVAILKLIIAHEMIHALQDQEIEFGERYRQAGTIAQQEDLVLRTEGHAVMCSELVIAEMGIGDAVGPMRDIFAGGVDPRGKTGSLLDAREVRSLVSVNYLASSDVFYAVQKASGHEAAWDLVAQSGSRLPFLRSSKEPQALANLVDSLVGVEEHLAPKNWTVGRLGLSVAVLLSSNFLRYEQALQLLASCQGGATWQAFGASPVIRRKLQALRFQDEASATAFRELAQWCAVEDLWLAETYAFRKMAAELDLGPSTRERAKVVEMASSAGFVVRALKQKKRTARADVQLYWFQSGASLLEVLCVNSPLEDGALEAAAASIFARLKP